MTDFVKGEPLVADRLNEIPEATLAAITPGAGLIKEQHGTLTTIRSTARSTAAGLQVDEVAQLPRVPSRGARIVYWYGDDENQRLRGGDGDYQLWVAYAGQTQWAPLQFATARSGIPFGIEDEDEETENES
ncbi:MAG: hypothetical protein M0O95_04005 [Clostridiales bacterium]|nr:hypothetical protein [Clostridiales bacterium]MCK9468703.1 hypothetical protein [Porticoccaceae bacterium]